MVARCVGRPALVFPWNTVTSFAPSAPGAGTNAGMTPKKPCPPASTIVRSGCATVPVENATSAVCIAAIRSSMERTARTSFSEISKGTEHCHYGS